MSGFGSDPILWWKGLEKVYTPNYSNDIRSLCCLWGKCRSGGNSRLTLESVLLGNIRRVIFGGEKAHFECHNVLVLSLCQLGSNVVPHNINKDTVYINTPVELYLQEKQRRQKVCGGGGKLPRRKLCGKGNFWQRMLRLVKITLSSVFRLTSI